MGKRGKVFGKREKEEGTSVKPFPCGPGRTRDNSTGTKNLVFMNMDRRSGGKGNRLPLFFSLLAFAVYFLYSLQSPSSSDEPNRSKHAFGIATSDVRGSMHSDVLALDKTISERQERLRQLREENDSLRQQQAHILEEVKRGNLRAIGASSSVSVVHQEPARPHTASALAPNSPPPHPMQLASLPPRIEFPPPRRSEEPLAAPMRTSATKTPRTPLPAAGSAVTFLSRSAHRYLAVASLEVGAHEYGWLRADAEEGSPISLRGFSIVPVENDWVALKSLGTGQFVEMVPPNERLAWVLRATGTTLQQRHHFRIDDDGKLFNRHCQAYVNVISDTPSNEIRGHGNAPRKSQGATRDDPGVDFQLRVLSAEEVRVNQQQAKEKADREHQKESHYVEQIKALPSSTEKRVVSYGLYGSNPKYATGAIRNSELVHVYFPGWVTRFYCDGSVPKKVLDTLKGNGAEIIFIDNIKGGIAGMFWRFLVADDPLVDRWIVRDTDSRLNPRERFAVEEWIQSGKAFHSIRDHPNHERPLNGGLIGGTKRAVPGIRAMIDRYPNKNRYGGDLSFLTEKVWPMIKNNQIGHDAYSCHKFPNSKPFPTKRPDNYQHVGQVFLIEGNRDIARMGDINGFMKGRDTPKQCRGRPEWRYG